MMGERALCAAIVLFAGIGLSALVEQLLEVVR